MLQQHAVRTKTLPSSAYMPQECMKAAQQKHGKEVTKLC